MPAPLGILKKMHIPARPRLGALHSGRFELLYPLGRGGFGAVYAARDLVSDQRVALKELGRASPDSLARFKQEFRALCGLHHPNLVGLKELFERDGRWFIVMELIGGGDFLSYVRPHAPPDNNNARPYDERRLRRALRGMAEGLNALHAFGVLHRDLKPSNVCITPEGRAVLLDFGLVTSTDPERQSTGALAVGTVAYMAPEQALGQTLGPAADFYALGVCLFEALTGQLPFQGSGLHILMQKQQTAAPRPADLAADVPADLGALCAALLQRDPRARPDGPALLAALGASPTALLPDPAVHALAGAAPVVFAGREAELNNLERALASTHEGALKLVLVEGESGVGKSELVAEFVRAAKLRQGSLLPLFGRCYENEQVPYKAFDGCVDELAKVLRRLADDECAQLLPPRAPLLAQLFPTLAQVPALTKPRPGMFSADPTARRLEAFAALAQLLAKLAEERPVVLVIDDLQWADSESFRLLQALVEPREPPPLLIIATIRPRDELEPEVLVQVEKVRAWKCTDVQPLFGLPIAQAELLAAELLAPLPADPAWVRAIAEESRGHPLLLSELVHYARSREIGEAGAISLDRALGARVEALDQASRDLLALVALAGRPYGSQVFARALDVPSVEDTARPLLMANLLRARKGHELSCFHDRIRSVVAAMLPRARLPYLHRQLAGALAADPNVDPAEQARHWEEAGERQQAAHAYEVATARALEALAFARAAELSERALSLLGDARDERYARLLVQKGHALARGGRSAEAAATYAEAADLAQGEARVRLQTSAANHLMLSVQVMPGLSAAQQVLAQVGVHLPLSTSRALLRFAWERLRYALFDRTLHKRSRAPARDRLALELITALNRSLAILHTPAYLALSAQHLRLAASLADPEQLVQAYAIQGWLRALRGSLQRAEGLLEKSRTLSEQLGRPQLSAWQALTEGTARITAWDSQGAERCLLRAHDLLQAHCPDQPRELVTARSSLGFAWFMLGQHKRIAENVEGWLAEARERQDHFAVAMLVGTGCGYIRHLMRDAPEQAMAELDAAIAKLPSDQFSFVHFAYCAAAQNALVYQGGAAALRWLEARNADHERRFLLKTRFGKDSRTIWWVLALLRAAEHMPPAERQRSFSRARRLVRRFERGPRSAAAYLALLVLAQLDVLEGHAAAAQRAIQRARRWAESINAAESAPCLYLEGILEGSGPGEGKCRAAVELIGARGWRNPERALSIQLPLLALLTQERTRRSEPGKLLRERYQLLGPLAEGAFGNVFEAYDLQTGRRVALKELVGKQARALQRFKREFRALQDIHHTNLVRLDALFEQNGSWYIAMELVEGNDLLSYVRVGGGCDLERLHRAFSGVVQALSALHELGLVHRDLTPHNVRVTAGGRAVVLDFGLLARQDEPDETPLLGTADYAAPEQLAGAAAHRTADMYALGVCLYQALTGQLPRAPTTASRLLPASRSQPPKPASSDTPELRLARALLNPEPLLRPGLTEVLSVLSPLTGSPAPSTRRSLAPPEEEGVFQGREQELAQLEQAFLRTQGLALSLIRGESGLGKSALVGELTRRLEHAYPNSLVLLSRCYENEQISLKAFDGAVDQLARVLTRLSTAECQALLPKKAALLAQLFPVLGGVPAIAGVGRKGLPVDPAARRLAALTCFFELLGRLSTRFALVLVIDDLQWGDSESFYVLRSLLAEHSALPLLVVCTAREDAEIEPLAARQLAELQGYPQVEVISLRGLSEEDAANFAARLLHEPVPPALVRRLVQESKGHPLFMRELIERAKTCTSASSALSLDEALKARITGLDADARAVLTLTALAGRSCPTQVLAAAMEQPEVPRAAVVQLLTQGLLRKRRGTELTCYHDRVREVACHSLSAERRRSLAGRLAQALDAEPSADPAERARLWDEAGQRERAIEAYEQAGDRAMSGLSFGQADRHYARALALLGERRDAVFCRLSVQHGHALVRLGKSAQAAGLFQQAAAVAHGELRIRLRIWTAQQLIQSAQVEEGLKAAERLLAELKLPFSLSEPGALLHIACERSRIALRGTQLKQRRAALAAAERLALEALHDLSSPVRAVSYLSGSLLVLQYLRRALDAGEADHSARALAYQALWRTVRDPRDSRAAWFERSRELAELSGDPAVIAEVALMRGYACVARGEFRRAPDHLSVAHELLQSRCAGEPWLTTASRMYLGCAWASSGEMRQLSQVVEVWLGQAKANQDRYAMAALAGFGGASLRHLMRDDPAAARAEIESCMAPWPAQPFSTNHFGALLVSVDALIHEGGGAALAWLDARRAEHDQAYLLKTPSFRTILNQRRAWACLAAIPARGDASQHPLFARALRYTRLVQRQHTNIAPAAADLLWSALKALQGHDEAALAHARRAQAGLSESAFGHGARYLEGLLLGRLEGAAKRDATLAWLASQGCINPQRYLCQLVPGIALLEDRAGQGS